MPLPIKIAIFSEIVLIISTLAILLRPEPLFAKSRTTALPTLQWVGVVLFCLTFVWSVLLGVLLEIHQLNGG